MTTPSTLIRDVRVFDGLQVSDADAVRLRGEIISEVGRGLTPEADEIVVDGAGATALPGLIDAHTHVFSGSLEQALAFGVTTELDIFADPHVVIALKTDARARRDLADLRSAGTGATVAGGQPTQLVARGYYPPFPTIGAATDLDRFVAGRVAEGSDYLNSSSMPAPPWATPAPRSTPPPSPRSSPLPTAADSSPLLTPATAPRPGSCLTPGSTSWPTCPLTARSPSR